MKALPLELLETFMDLLTSPTPSEIYGEKIFELVINNLSVTRSELSIEELNYLANDIATSIESLAEIFNTLFEPQFKTFFIEPHVDLKDYKMIIYKDFESEDFINEEFKAELIMPSDEEIKQMLRTSKLIKRKGK